MSCSNERFNLVTHFQYYCQGPFNHVQYMINANVICLFRLLSHLRIYKETTMSLVRTNDVLSFVHDAQFDKVIDLFIHKSSIELQCQIVCLIISFNTIEDMSLSSSSSLADAIKQAYDYLSRSTQPIFFDPKPEIIRKTNAEGPVVYQQKVLLRYLQPPPVPEPGVTFLIHRFLESMYSCLAFNY